MEKNIYFLDIRAPQHPGQICVYDLNNLKGLFMAFVSLYKWGYVPNYYRVHWS